jgi:hypothetical protein
MILPFPKRSVNLSKSPLANGREAVDPGGMHSPKKEQPLLKPARNT